MTKRLVIGNWKMNGSLALVDAMKSLPNETDVDVVIVPPAVYLAPMVHASAGEFTVGLQTIGQFSSGAHTGEVAASMASEIGAQWVLVGHSERRDAHGENDEVVAAKAEQGLAAGLSVVVCVGESLAEREAGRAEAFVSQQVRAQATSLRTKGTVAIAYEPIWSIGTGKIPSEQYLNKTFDYLTQYCKKKYSLKPKILYGGSVNENNINVLKNIYNCSGFLIGGASLKYKSFTNLIKNY